jgi:hypothetical protein
MPIHRTINQPCTIMPLKIDTVVNNTIPRFPFDCVCCMEWRQQSRRGATLCLQITAKQEIRLATCCLRFSFSFSVDRVKAVSCIDSVVQRLFLHGSFNAHSHCNDTIFRRNSAAGLRQERCDQGLDTTMQELSQDTKNALQCLTQAVRKVDAYCILYLLAHVPQVDPKLISFDNATLAGQQAVVRRHQLLQRYVHTPDVSALMLPRACS